MLNPTAVAFTILLIAATILISFYTRRFNQTTAEFYLAGRKIGYYVNASAICGDYFSAASFLGVAAAVYSSGLDGVWFGAGFGAGFVPVVIFFAAPLRRFGEYTLPDFLAARFQSSAIRIAAVVAVQVITLFYLAPQVVASGQIWEVLVGREFFGLDGYTTGLVLATVVMALYGALGGMRGTTWNQLVQFWVLFTALLMIVAAALAYGFSYASALREVDSRPLTAPAVYKVRDLPVQEARRVMSDRYWQEKVEPHLGNPDAEVVVLVPVKSRLTGREMRFTEPGARYNALALFSGVLTLILGTSGLPHIMNRFFTNPSGTIARTTTVYVLGLVGAFYVCATTVGVVGRSMAPDLLARTLDPHFLKLAVDGVLVYTDTIVPFLGQSLGGSFGLGYVAAGAFAAVFSTMGGLLMASAASWGHDLYEQYINPTAPEWKRVAVGKASVVFMSVVGLIVGLTIPHTGLSEAYPAMIALMVTWAFGVAGGAFFPVLLMAIWWRKVTLKGAMAGMVVGGGGAVLVIASTLLSTVWPGAPAPIHALAHLTFPAVVTVPLAILVIWFVSLYDGNLPTNIDEIWLRIHGTARERTEARRRRLVRYETHTGP